MTEVNTPTQATCLSKQAAVSGLALPRSWALRSSALLHRLNSSNLTSNQNLTSEISSRELHANILKPEKFSNPNNSGPRHFR